MDLCIFLILIYTRQHSRLDSKSKHISPSTCQKACVCLGPLLLPLITRGEAIDSDSSRLVLSISPDLSHVLKMRSSIDSSGLTALWKPFAPSYLMIGNACDTMSGGQLKLNSGLA